MKLSKYTAYTPEVSTRILRNQLLSTSVFTVGKVKLTLIQSAPPFGVENPAPYPGYIYCRQYCGAVSADFRKAWSHQGKRRPPDDGRPSWFRLGYLFINNIVDPEIADHTCGTAQLEGDGIASRIRGGTRNQIKRDLDPVAGSVKRTSIAMAASRDDCLVDAPDVSTGEQLARYR